MSPNILMTVILFLGKTTILYRVKQNEYVSTISTIGINVETVAPVKGITFTMWDIGPLMRRLSKHYYQNAEGFDLIFSLSRPHCTIYI